MIIKKIALPFKDYRLRSKVMFVSVTGVMLGIVSQTNLALNKSSSLPYKAFFCVKFLQPNLGNLALIEDHPTAYFGSMTYVKEVSGLPGDQIHIKEDYLKVADNPIGMFKATTRNGSKLQPVKASKIPQGYVFVSAGHPDSFDSRYQEFGLVKKSHITARCFGVGLRSLNKSEACS